jgi:CheY-like chemotaxis protein
MACVLVVDDDEGTRDTYRAALRHEGYDVRLADSRLSAIRNLSGAGLPHALFLDLNLGDATGLDVLRWMRERYLFVPTAAMTAFRSAFDPDEAIELGALAYVDQPLSVDMLVGLARSLIKPPSPNDDPNHLHTRVLAGDPGAIECLDAIFLKKLPPRLERAFPRGPWDFAVDAVSAACLEYAGGAARLFDQSTRRSVVDFVFALAWRNLDDQLRSEASRARRQEKWLRERLVVAEPEVHPPARGLDLWAATMTVTRNLRERQAAEVLLNGGNVLQIASALGCGHLPTTERGRVAKQFRERLIKRLSRYVRTETFYS